MDLLMNFLALFIDCQAYIWHGFFLGMQICHHTGQVGIRLMVRGIILLTVWDCIEDIRFFQRNFMGSDLVAPDL